MLEQETGLRLDLERTQIDEIDLQIDLQSLFTGSVDAKRSSGAVSTEWGPPERPTLLVVELESLFLTAPGVQLLLGGVHLEVRGVALGELSLASCMQAMLAMPVKARVRTRRRGSVEIQIFAGSSAARASKG